MALQAYTNMTPKAWYVPLIIASALLAGCAGNQVVVTGSTYPALASDSPVRAYLGEERPDACDEIGVREIKVTHLFLTEPPLAKAVRIVSKEAREVGGDAVVLIGSSADKEVFNFPGDSHTTGATWYRFAVVRLKPAPDEADLGLAPADP